MIDEQIEKLKRILQTNEQPEVYKELAALYERVGERTKAYIAYMNSFQLTKMRLEEERHKVIGDPTDWVVDGWYEDFDIKHILPTRCFVFHERVTRILTIVGTPSIYVKPICYTEYGPYGGHFEIERLSTWPEEKYMCARCLKVLRTDKKVQERALKAYNRKEL